VKLSFPLSFHPQAHSAAQMGLCVWRMDGYAWYQSYIDEIFSLSRFNTIDEIRAAANKISNNDTELFLLTHSIALSKLYSHEIMLHYEVR